MSFNRGSQHGVMLELARQVHESLADYHHRMAASAQEEAQDAARDGDWRRVIIARENMKRHRMLAREAR